MQLEEQYYLKEYATGRKIPFHRICKWKINNFSKKLQLEEKYLLKEYATQRAITFKDFETERIYLFKEHAAGRKKLITMPYETHELFFCLRK
jgi:hypothetical protein